MGKKQQQQQMVFIDISYPYIANMAIYPNNPDYEKRKYRSIDEGDSCNISLITMGTHTGTHIDVPSHVYSNGKTIDQFSLDTFVGLARVFAFDGKESIGKSDFNNKTVNKNDIILLRTDNSRKCTVGEVLDRYVTLTYEAAELLAEKEIKMIGIDYLTIERPRNTRITGKSIHKIFLDKEIPILEGVNLSSVKEGIYHIYCFPLNIYGADGSPVRAVLETGD